MPRLAWPHQPGRLPKAHGMPSWGCPPLPCGNSGHCHWKSIPSGRKDAFRGSGSSRCPGPTPGPCCGHPEDGDVQLWPWKGSARADIRGRPPPPCWPLGSLSADTPLPVGLYSLLLSFQNKSYAYLSLSHPLHSMLKPWHYATHPRARVQTWR